jgi:hypothetical protein
MLLSIGTAEQPEPTKRAIGLTKLIFTSTLRVLSSTRQLLINTLGARASPKQVIVATICVVVPTLHLE